MSSVKKWLMYDLHMHSYASKKKDLSRVKLQTAEEFVDPLLKHGIEVFSVTDHNTFDHEFYDKLKDYIKDKNMRVINGAELDVYVDDKHFFQMGVYFSPLCDTSSISTIIDELYNDSKKPKLSDIITKLFSLKSKFILIPEGDKQHSISKVLNYLDEGMTDDIYKFAMYKIFSAYDVSPHFDEVNQNTWAQNFYEHSIKAAEILKDKTEEEKKSIFDSVRKKIIDLSTVLSNETNVLYEYIIKYGSYYAYFTFSDWHNAEIYTPKLNNFIYGSLDTYFDSFELAVLDPKSRIIRTIDKEIVIPGNILGAVHFSTGAETHNVNFAPGLNVIVGKRGSGKSLLLSVIERLNKKDSEEIKKYKVFGISNISGNNYDGITLAEGQLSSIAIIKQDRIKEVYENPDLALKTIASKFPTIADYDKSKLDKIVALAKGVKPYDKNYKSITAVIKQIKKQDSFTYSTYKTLSFSLIESPFANTKTFLEKIKVEIDKTGINSKYISAQISALNKNLIYYKKLYELFNSIIEKHNERIVALNRGKTDLQKVMTDLRNEINTTLNNMKNNFSILLNYRKLKFSLDNLVMDTPKIEKDFVNKYMFVTSYIIPENINDLLIEELTKTIGRLKNDPTSFDLVEKYLEGEKTLKSNYTNISDEISKFVNNDIFVPKKEFFLVNSSVVRQTKIENYDDIIKLINEALVTSLKNASLGMQSVAYLDLIFDLSESILLFDQPEDNIDNDYISNYLVPLIKAKKREKQLIFVTHNPSVAVYGDAFNYIYAVNDGKISYKNYQIENSKDKDEIMKILDGGKPSFSNRNKKYGNILGEEEYGNNTI